MMQGGGVVVPGADQGGPFGAPLVFGLVGLAGLVDHWFGQLPAMLTASAAFVAAVGAALPSASAFLDRRQARRHAEGRYRREHPPG